MQNEPASFKNAYMRSFIYVQGNGNGSATQSVVSSSSPENRIAEHEGKASKKVTGLAIRIVTDRPTLPCLLFTLQKLMEKHNHLSFSTLYKTSYYLSLQNPTLVYLPNFGCHKERSVI